MPEDEKIIATGTYYLPVFNVQFLPTRPALLSPRRIAAVQLCRYRGARIIAVASISRLSALDALGADDLIDRNCDNLEAQIRHHAGGTVDVVLDVNYRMYQRYQGVFFAVHRNAVDTGFRQLLHLRSSHRWARTD